MSNEFWLGTFLSVPLALTAWLFQRQFEPYLNRWSEARKARTVEQSRREFALIWSFKEGREDIKEYLLYNIMLLVIAGTIVMVIFSIREMIMILVIMPSYVVGGGVIDGHRIMYLQSAIGVMMQLFVLSFCIFAVRKASTAIRIYSRYKNFETYAEAVAPIIGSKYILSLRDSVSEMTGRKPSEG